jgi:hypothetical protein
MTPSITATLPVTMPVEATVRVVCVTDPEKPVNVSGAIPESIALKRVRRLRDVNHDQVYDLFPVPSTERATWRRS